MKVKTQSLSAQGVAPWFPVNRLSNPMLIGLLGDVDSGSTLTYAVQYTYDSLDHNAQRNPTSITRAATVATVVDPNHGLAVNDSVLVLNSGNPAMDGEFAVATVVDANSYTYTVANSGITAALPGVKVRGLKVVTHPTITGKNARFEGSIATPVTALRLAVTAWTAGRATLSIVPGGKI